MKFSKRNCRVLHLGRNSPMNQYIPGATQLESSLLEKDLGVQLGTNLNVSQKYALMAKKVNSTLGCMRYCQQARKGDHPLYSALVKLHLECFVQFQTLQYQRDLDILKKVQYRAAVILKRLKHLCNGESWDRSAWRRRRPGCPHPCP